jgi:4'-phosphopantetheinyl transferase
MVYLYVTDVSGLPDPLEFKKLFQSLTFERQIRIQRMRSLAHRKQSLGAGLLLQSVLQKYGLSQEQIRISSSGKPMCEGLHFNLSHSGSLVICAVGDTPVGCDVEQLREAPRTLASRFVCEREKEYLNGCNSDIYDKEFYRLWTMKESYMKYTGEGIKLPLNAFEIVQGEQVCILRDGDFADCKIHECEVPGYCISVCTKDTEVKMCQVEVVKSK